MKGESRKGENAWKIVQGHMRALRDLEIRVDISRTGKTGQRRAVDITCLTGSLRIPRWIEKDRDRASEGLWRRVRGPHEPG